MFMRALIGILALLAAPTSAALVIWANAESDSIAVGSSTTLDIVLAPTQGEQPSVFEGRFGLSGIGDVADVSIDDEGFESWSFAASSIVDDLLIVSLTSENLGGQRTIARLTVIALAPGVFDLNLAEPTFASTDTDMFPFIVDLPIETAIGNSLADIRVQPTSSEVPEPPTSILFGLAICVFALIAWIRTPMCSISGDLHVNKRNVLACLGFVLAAHILPLKTAHGASVTAIQSADVVALGETFTIDLFLNLEQGERASVFEGRFQMTGQNTVDIILLSEGGPSWDSSFGSLSNDSVNLSLASNNSPLTSRLLARLELSAANAGDFQLQFDQRTFASFDISEFPFIEDLPLANSPGEVLASVQTIPLPASGWAALSAFALLSLISIRRRKQGR
ncbi:MAG: hypothetical protein AAF497_18765 [Planctomycetota bacterium]